MNKFMKIVCLCFALLLGVVIGYHVAIKNGRVMDEKKVAFRVELSKDDIDYDLSAMLSYLKCKYEKVCISGSGSCDVPFSAGWLRR